MRMVGIGFSLLLYRVVTSIFRYYDISHDLYLKVSLFLISILVAYIVYQSILIRIKRQFQVVYPRKRRGIK